MERRRSDYLAISLGTVVLLAGLVTAIFPVINYKRVKAVNVGGARIERSVTETIRVPRLVSFAAVAAGSALLFIGGRYGRRKGGP
ncbi:MAG TPA: hypothetical protein ENJ37_07020 [Deltaproteobacteria bacterium]|nr:hypothetical protein [Deltaproteobacteria bacterium]